MKNLMCLGNGKKGDFPQCGGLMFTLFPACARAGWSVQFGRICRLPHGLASPKFWIVVAHTQGGCRPIGAGPFPILCYSRSNCGFPRFVRVREVTKRWTNLHRRRTARRSEEHTPELQSLTRTSEDVFYLKHKKQQRFTEILSDHF